ncbi:hypothetical protein C5C37_15290 [Rathayibacter sp. AY1F9]|nr:hypothetical protein C5C37_15290 [Rathayibacter sp. AY1F9]
MQQWEKRRGGDRLEPDSATARPFFTASVLVPVRLAIAAADTPSNASCAHAAVRSATLSSARWSFSMIC